MPMVFFSFSFFNIEITHVHHHKRSPVVPCVYCWVWVESLGQVAVHLVTRVRGHYDNDNLLLPSLWVPGIMGGEGPLLKSSHAWIMQASASLSTINRHTGSPGPLIINETCSLFHKETRQSCTLSCSCNKSCTF